MNPGCSLLECDPGEFVGKSENQVKPDVQVPGIVVDRSEQSKIIFWIHQVDLLSLPEIIAVF